MHNHAHLTGPNYELMNSTVKNPSIQRKDIRKHCKLAKKHNQPPYRPTPAHIQRIKKAHIKPCAH